MGKPLIQQRRGKGSPTFRAPSHRYKANVKYPSYEEKKFTGVIEKLLHSTGFSAPLAKIRLNTGKIFYNIAAQKIFEGQQIEVGEGSIVEGNILPLSKIPDGTLVYNIEIKPGDGGKLVRTAGSAAKIIKHVGNDTIVLLPSKQEKVIDGRARATIGVVAGGGRKEKPLVKAGKAYYAKKATNRYWPRTSAVKMNAVEHPFGGGRGKVIGKPKTPPRFASPGRKVGLLRARRTGRKKKK